MDFKKIFLKDACPTSMGGQAVMDGIMMRGKDRYAVAIRLDDGRIHIKTEMIKPSGKAAKVPIIRGMVAFVNSLVIGMKTLLYSADVVEEYGKESDEEQNAEKSSDSATVKRQSFIERKFGAKAAWKVSIFIAVLISIGFTIGFFILLPTVAVNLLSDIINSSFLLNAVEGILRLAIFIGYIAAIRHLKDIKTTFQYHGAEHKSIHCFENGLELTPQNAQQFYTLHPRCGTSFLMFVMIISLVLFSLLGWPNLWMRLLSRIVLIPIVAGLSYELLKWAGRSDNWVVKILSLPGLLLQKLTTAPPSDDQLEVAIASIKAVLVSPETDCYEGICGLDGKLIEKRIIGGGDEDESIGE